MFVDHASEASALWDELVSAGARPVGYEALEVLRVEAGVPRYGVDVSDANVVLEAGLDESVSFNKGCYIGQEIIARIHWRGHVAKRLTGLVFDDDRRESATRDANVKTADGKEIGRITSSVFSPQLNRAVALGIVKYDYLQTGTEVRVAVKGNEDERAAHVAELPLVRGSWFEVDTNAESPTSR
jgi:folate-binding protein YgfZ